MVREMTAHGGDISVKAILHEIQEESVFIADQSFRRFEPVNPAGDL